MHGMSCLLQKLRKRATGAQRREKKHTSDTSSVFPLPLFFFVRR